MAQLGGGSKAPLRGGQRGQPAQKQSTFRVGLRSQDPEEEPTVVLRLRASAWFPRLRYKLECLWGQAAGSLANGVVHLGTRALPPARRDLGLHLRLAERAGGTKLSRFAWGCHGFQADSPSVLGKLAQLVTLRRRPTVPSLCPRGTGGAPGLEVRGGDSEAWASFPGRGRGMGAPERCDLPALWGETGRIGITALDSGRLITGPQRPHPHNGPAEPTRAQVSWGGNGSLRRALRAGPGLRRPASLLQGALPDQLCPSTPGPSCTPLLLPSR